MEQHVRILTSSAITIQRVAALLEEAGIAVLIKDHTESARLAGFGSAQNNVDLLVDSGDSERARAILAVEREDLEQ